MDARNLCIILLGILVFSCKSEQKTAYIDNKVSVVGAMRNVMWKGELNGTISLDTISNKDYLYGLGPTSYLTGELLIINGKSYVSKVSSDSTMVVEESYDISAPFFVYANVKSWTEMNLPSHVKSIQDVEKFIDKKTTDYNRPFAFKLVGKASEANIHIQNLPKGTKVSSPQEAHQGQIQYQLSNEEVEIVGFFSTEHQGIFTHHDSFLHMHLITSKKDKMGHLDHLNIDQMILFLPKQ
jgi:acetolactate decarboxylase